MFLTLGLATCTTCNPFTAYWLGGVMPEFPRAARMLQPSDFAATLRTRPVAKGSVLVLNHKRADPAERARLGLIVPKRFLKHAVSRNAVKRVVREFFRNNQHLLPPGTYAFRVHSKVEPMTLTALKLQVALDCRSLLSRLGRS